MASFAAVWNPLAISPHRLLVFYNSTKGNLGLRQWEPEQKQWGTFWDERAESVKGNVKVGGGFAAFVWRNWVSKGGHCFTPPPFSCFPFFVVAAASCRLDIVIDIQNVDSSIRDRFCNRKRC